MGFLWYFLIFVLGTIIGSFLNVVIYRLHTGRTIGGRSHCLSCGKVLKWYELLPLLSYVIQGARCRSCASHMPVRYFAVELLGGLSFLFLWSLFGADPMLFGLYAVLFAVLIVIGVYDLRHAIIPDELTLITAVLALLFLMHSIFVLGSGWQNALMDIAGGSAAGLFFGGLWYLSKGRWLGFGDAKLSVPLGVIAGFSGVFSMVVLSFWVGAVISLIVMLFFFIVKKGKSRIRRSLRSLTMKSEIPFAPFLIAGFLLVELFHADIFEIMFWIISVIPFW